MKIGRSAFLNPVFLVCLFILILNDHYLKSHYPSFLTGKLSDFSGLLVFAVFTAFLFRKILVSRERLILHHIAIAALFLTWKMAPIEGMLDSINGLFGIQMFGRVKDASDLMALAILPFGYKLFIDNEKRAHIQPNLGFIKRIFVVLAICLASLAIIATPGPPPPLQYISGNVIESPAQMPGAEFMYLVQEVLNQNGFKTKEMITWDDTCYEINAEFNYKRLPKGIRDSWNFQIKSFQITIELYISKMEDFGRINAFNANLGSPDFDLGDSRKIEDAENIIDAFFLTPLKEKLTDEIID